MKCKNCKKDIETIDIREDLGTCYYCVPPEMPRQRKIDVVRATGLPEQIAKLEEEIALAEKYNPKKVYEKPKAKVLKGHEAIDKFVSENVLSYKRHTLDIDDKLLQTLFVKIYNGIVIQEKGHNAIFNDEIKEKIIEFLNWLYKDNGNKSLYIYSTHGTGKSTMLKAAVYLEKYLKQYSNWKRSYSLCEMDELVVKARMKGIDVLEIFNDGYWFVDDIQERHMDMKHYGNDMRVIDDMLYLLHQRSKKGYHCVVTSNITPNELKEALEPRLYKRFKEQYKSIKFKNVDNRI